MKTISVAAMLASIAAILAGTALAFPSKGQTAPALTITRLDGNRWDLAEWRGKVVVVNFWATWCSTCRDEMPAFDAFYARFHSRGVELVGISIDRRRDRELVTKTASSVHYPCAMLANAETNDFGKPTVVPMTFVIGRDGKVRAVLMPQEKPVAFEDLATAVLPLLADPRE